MKVVMVVNNPGSNDVRVVKEAELIVAAEGECVVIGIFKEGFSQYEVINGVKYVRLKLKIGIVSFLLGFFPFLAFRLSDRHVPQMADDYNHNQSEVFNHGSCVPGRKRNLFSKGLRGCGKVVYYVLFKFIKKYKVFHPIYVRFIQGRYLATLLPVIRAVDADILHAHELWVLEACAMAKGSRVLIYDSHELELHRNNDWPSRSRKVMAELEKRYISYVDHVIAVSGGCAEIISKEYLVDDVTVVRNTPLLSMQKPSKSDVRQDLKLDQATPLMVYTGSVTINRGIESVLSVLGELPGCHFVCVGPQNKALCIELHVLAETLKVSGRFHMLPPVPPGELVNYISTADLAVIPIQDACLSYRHCLPNKLFEAMHAGLPIVASDLPDMRSVIVNEGIGYVANVLDTSEFRLSIEQALLVGKKAYPEERVCNLRQEYCFERDFSKIISLYNSIEFNG